MSEFDARLAAIWRIESPRLIAGLSRLTRDVGLAEELASDAFVAALVQWRDEGVPANPGAWLTSVAKRRAIDRFRREDTFERKRDELGREMAAGGFDAVDAFDDEAIDDDLLRLMFVAAHPVLPAQSRVALMLRLLGGLTTPEIARAFLVPEPTIAQRIVRAKRTLTEAGVPFEVPPIAQRGARLGSVLDAIYLIFNEGYSATAGDDAMRPALCEDALRLGRVLARLMAEEPEVHGLVALMELQASRLRARAGEDGEPVLLLDQDRTKWDYVLINRGLAALQRAQTLGGALGPFGLQAAIAAAHASSPTPEATPWTRIAAIYDALAEVLPTPVVALNRAVAISMAYGPAEALPLVDALAEEPALRAYHLLPSVRGDLLEKLGRFGEARLEYERAASLAGNARDRALLRERAARASQRV